MHFTASVKQVLPDILGIELQLWGGSIAEYFSVQQEAKAIRTILSVQGERERESPGALLYGPTTQPRPTRSLGHPVRRVAAHTAERCVCVCA